MTLVPFSKPSPSRSIHDRVAAFFDAHGRDLRALCEELGLVRVANLMVELELTALLPFPDRDAILQILDSIEDDMVSLPTEYLEQRFQTQDDCKRFFWLLGKVSSLKAEFTFR